MAFRSYKNSVVAALEVCAKEFCDAVGVLGVAEVQSITPVNKDPKAYTRGNLKKSIVAETMPNNDGVYIGVTPNAPYGLYVEKGIGQPAQPFLEPGILNATKKIYDVARKIYTKKMGDK